MTNNNNNNEPIANSIADWLEDLQKKIKKEFMSTSKD